jgi:hypothetical protein
MNSRRVSAVVAALAAVIVVAPWGVPSFAASSTSCPTDGPCISSTDPQAALPGVTVTVTGTGFPANSGDCSLTWDDTDLPDGCQVDDLGELTATFGVPTDATPGDHAVSALADGGASATGTVTVLAAARGTRWGAVTYGVTPSPQGRVVTSVIIVPPVEAQSVCPTQAACLDSVAPDTARPGDAVTVTGANFPPDDPDGCGLSWDTSFLGSDCHLDDHGGLSATFVVPGDATPGEHTVVAFATGTSAPITLQVPTPDVPVPDVVVPDVQGMTWEQARSAL